MKKLRDHIDDICIKDKFERNGMIYTVEQFEGERFVFVEAQDEAYDCYTARNETLLNEINEYHKNKKS